MPETAPAAEPYRDLRQQRDAAMMGMYIFLGSEIMLFGGLFAVAAGMRLTHAPEVVQASRALHFGIGGLNTLVLLTSSLFVVLGVEKGKAGRRAAAGWLAAAAALGVCFLAIKAYEYRSEFVEGLLPLPGVESRYATSVQHLFMDLYLVATGLHAVHLMIGIAVLLVLSVQTMRAAIPLPQRAIALVVAGLYWHLIDVIWIFLYPVFYLAR
jgi:cytochrome c oxidase subunit 3